MATITITYRQPRTRQLREQQRLALASVQLQSAVEPNELTLLRLVEARRTATANDAYVELQIVYTTLGAVGDLPSFEALFPTPEAQQGAVQNLWTNRLQFALNNTAKQISVVFS